MKFTVVAVGKLKERFWVDACAEYLKRLQPYAKTQVREIADIDPRKAGGVDGARDKEGAAICAEIEKLGADTHLVLLAIDGKERSSEGLSKRLDNLMLQGKSNFAFVIGGSDGVSDEVRKRANELLVYCFRHFSRSGRALYLPFQIWDKGRVEGGGRRTTSWDLALDDRIAPPTRSVTWIRQDGRSGLDI